MIQIRQVPVQKKKNVNAKMAINLVNAIEIVRRTDIVTITVVLMRGSDTEAENAANVIECRR